MYDIFYEHDLLTLQRKYKRYIDNWSIQSINITCGLFRLQNMIGITILLCIARGLL